MIQYPPEDSERGITVGKVGENLSTQKIAQ